MLYLFDEAGICSRFRNRRHITARMLKAAIGLLSADEEIQVATAFRDTRLAQTWHRVQQMLIKFKL